MKGESKHDRFRRVAEARTRKLLAMMNLLGNCSKQNVYEYTDSEVEQIFGAIDIELARLKELYRQPEKKNEAFSLSDEL